MKLSLLCTAVLVSSSLASFGQQDAKDTTSSTVTKNLHRMLKESKPIGLIAAMAGEHKAEKEMKRFMKRFSWDSSDHGGLKDILKVLDKDGDDDKEVMRVVLSMPEDAVKKIGVDHVTKILNVYPAAFSSYTNLPAEFFANEDFVKALLKNFKTTNMKPEEVDKIFTTLTVDQFAKLMSKNPNFHADTFTGTSLNRLAESLDEKQVTEYIRNVSPKFLDSINKQEDKRVPLDEAVVEALPKTFLSEIKYAPHPKDAQYFTESQLRALKDPKCKSLNLRQVPAKRMQYINAKVLKELDNLKNSQLSKLTVSQWNEILSKKDGCKLLANGITLKNVSEIDFNAKCFSSIGSEIQAFVLANHDSLPDDILSYVTKDMVEELEYKGATGLGVIAKCKNKKVLRHIGENVSDSKNPLKGATPEDMKKLKEYIHELSESSLAMMKIRAPSTLEQLRKDAEFVAALDDVYEIINKISNTKRGLKTKKNDKVSDIWSKLTASDVERLMGPSYSKLPASITEDAFDQLSPEALLAVPASAIVKLRFFNDLTTDDYTSFGDAAFAMISSDQKTSFHIGYLRDVQIPHVSSSIQDSKKSFFAVIKTEDLLALGEKRLLLLTAPQLGALQPSAFKSLINKSFLPQVTPAATAQFTKAQLDTLSDDVLSSITPGQIEVLVNNLGEALGARKDKLNSDAKAAFEKFKATQAATATIKTSAGSVSYGMGSTALMAVAGAALLLL